MVLSKARAKTYKLAYKYGLWVLTYFVLSCSEDDQPDLSLLHEIVGQYEGDYNHEFGWASYRPKVFQQNDTLYMNYWPSGPDSIILKLDGNKLMIEEQIFNLEAHSQRYGHLYYYELKLKAKGVYHKGIIDMTFTEDIKKDTDVKFSHKDSGTIHLLKQ